MPENEKPIDWPNLTIFFARWGQSDAEEGDVYLVWFCYILGGWKALLSTTIPDGRYYEVTFNAQKSEVYLDTYKKTHNKTITITD